MSFVLISKNNFTTLCCLLFWATVKQRKCCFGSGKSMMMFFALAKNGNLAQDGSRSSGNSKKLTVSTRNTWCPVIATATCDCRDLSNDNVLLQYVVESLVTLFSSQYSRRESIRFCTLESESLYTRNWHQVKRSKHCQIMAFCSASRRIFFQTNFTRGISTLAYHSSLTKSV